MAKRYWLLALLVFFLTVSAFFAGFGARDALADVVSTPLGIRLVQLLPEVYEVVKGDNITAPGSLKPLATFTEALEQIRANYVEKLDDKKNIELTYGAIRGMVKALDDPYSRFMDPEQYREFNVDTSGEFEGIGASLATITLEDTKERAVVILAVLENQPAEKAGLKAGDIIRRVDGQSTADMDINEVVDMIRGPRDTTVVIGVERKGHKGIIDIPVVRKRVEFPVIESKMLDGKIGYIWLRQFNRHATEKAKEAISKLTEQGMRGLILDLSSDPGGLLDQAVRVGSLFIEGPIVYIKERGQEPKAIEAVPGGPVVPKSLPMAVIIDGASASASEIVAGALQDTGRAIVVGQPSFGKSAVQTIIELKDKSAIALTTAKYLTPKKRDLHKTKIQPDVKVPLDENGDPKQQHQKAIDAAVRELQRKLGGA